MAILQSGQQSIEIRLGSDLKFPIEGTFEPIKGLDLLLQDIQQLLLTIPGERVFRPEYGCNIQAKIWENYDSAVEEGVAAIESSLKTFEPRIVVGLVTGEVNENTDLITFNIEFRVIETDVNVNLIFPFRTGTQLSFS